MIVRDSRLRGHSLCLYIKTDISIIFVVLKTTFYHEDVARIIIMKNGATLDRNVHCFLCILKGYLSDLWQGHRKVQNIFLMKQKALVKAI